MAKRVRWSLLKKRIRYKNFIEQTEGVWAEHATSNLTLQKLCDRLNDPMESVIQPL